MLLLPRSENRTNGSAAADGNSVLFTLEEMLGIFPQRTKNFKKYILMKVTKCPGGREGEEEKQ